MDITSDEPPPPSPPRKRAKTIHTCDVRGCGYHTSHTGHLVFHKRTQPIGHEIYMDCIQ